jgi:hypothetical protein
MWARNLANEGGHFAGLKVVLSNIARGRELPQGDIVPYPGRYLLKFSLRYNPALADSSFRGLRRVGAGRVNHCLGAFLKMAIGEVGVMLPLLLKATSGTN